MSKHRRERLYLVAGSLLLLTVIVVSLGFLFSAERIVRREGETLHEVMLSQNSWLTRLNLALTRARNEGRGASEGGGLAPEQREGFRVLLSQAALAPALPGRDSLAALLGEDPLLVLPRLEESESVYRVHLGTLESLYRRMEAGESGEGLEPLDAGLGASLDAFRRVLADRATVLEQLDATLHAGLRRSQQTTRHRIRLVLLFQLAALLSGSALVISAFRSQASKVAELAGLIPICARCKNVRDDEGYWTRVEAYIRDRTSLEFTHGLCPDCASDLYPDLDLSSDDVAGDPGPP